MNDDLQLVRGLLPAQPPPTAEVTAASRGRLLATMTTGSPFPQVPAPLTALLAGLAACRGSRGRRRAARDRW